MERLGVIDLGSNSVRLVVYEVKRLSGKRISKKDFSTLVDMKKMAGLSAYVSDGVFSKEGIEKASYILSRHLVRARNVGCERVEIFATAVIRNCANSDEVVKVLEKEVGRKIHLLSGEQEARLDFVGACCERDIESGTLIDIGGGSTELVNIEDGKALACVSLDQGSVSAYAQFVDTVLPTKRERVRIARALEERLMGVEGLDSFRSPVLYGVGGSVRAVAKMKGALAGSLKVPKRFTRDDVDELMALLEKRSAEFAHIASRAAPDRLHTIGCGLAMVHLLMRELEASQVEVCRYGVREGFLVGSMLEACGKGGR